MITLEITDLQTKYNAVLDEFLVGRSKYQVSGEYWGKGLRPCKGIRTETYRGLKISLGLLGTRIDRIKNSAKLLSDLKECLIHKDGLYYEVTLLEQDIMPEEYDEEAEYLNIDLSLISITEPVQIKVTTSNTSINNVSPKSGELQLELFSPTNVVSYTVQINDQVITVQNIKANETVYIGSGIVMAGGVSKIDDVDIWKFPYLSSGTNNIIVSSSNVTLTLKYSIRW